VQFLSKGPADGVAMTCEFAEAKMKPARPDDIGDNVRSLIAKIRPKNKNKNLGAWPNLDH